MKIARAFCLIALLVFAESWTGGHRLAAQPNPAARFWAAVGVVKPAFQKSETAKLSLDFIVVNDGSAVANPAIGASHLFINGIEPGDWRMVINNGLRSSWFEALPPGKVLSFGYQLGPRYFGTPGIYRVRWEGQEFKSAELTFRVLPDGSWDLER